MNKKKIMTFALLASASVGSFLLNSDSAYASDHKTRNTSVDKSTMNSKGKVINITTSLRIRSGAGTNHHTIGYLKNGEIFNIIGKSGDWYKIDFRNQVGYIYRDYVKILNDSEPITSKRGKVINITSSLRMRSGAGINHHTIGYLKNGQEFEILGEFGDWYKIKVNGKNGFVSREYVKVISSKTEDNSHSNNSFKAFEGRVVNVETALRVRSGASISSSIKGYIYNGDKVDIIDKSGSWYRIKKGSLEGYTSSEYIKEISKGKPSDSDKPNKPNKPIENENSTKPFEINGVGKVVNITSTLRIRSGAGTSYSIVGSMHNGDNFEIIGKLGEWYKIKKGTVIGYVYDEYVQLIHNNTQKPEETIKPEETVKPIKPEETVKPVKPEENPDSQFKDKFGIVNVNSLLNVRDEANIAAKIIGELRSGDRVIIKGEKNGFYEIQTSSIKKGYASKDYIKINDKEFGEHQDENIQSNLNGKLIHTSYDISLDEYVKLQQSRVPNYSYEYFEQYINPSKSTNNYQFLRIDKFRDIDVAGLNSYLDSKDAGVLKGTASTFRSVSKKYGLDPIYLISQSLHETGYGKSRLAKGVTITEIANPNKEIRNSKGELIGYEMIKLAKPTTVYNLFGIGAYDNTNAFPNRALILGTTYAYNKGWTSIEKAIEGAAEFVSLNYVNSSRYEQNTIYKMRYMYNVNYIWHQYATSPWYAQSIGNLMSELSHLYKNGTEFLYDKPRFNPNSRISFKSISNNDKNKKEMLLQEQSHVSLIEY